ncbi:exodeoxyribonuclease VII small subunit [Marinilabiliaceae bacterium ANBcel2]|nr:exodeoxyribonuclease VII small subunit [Marinilabiliaceae bacterium ANBcel2]
MSDKELSYKEAVTEIEDILSKMEEEELDVDDLSAKVKRVSFLIYLCRKKLLQTEEEVEKVLKEIDNE